jgi:hypothetical protein
MPREVTKLSIAQDLLTAAFGRKTARGRINKVIDAFCEDKPVTDNALHFANEVLLHRSPRRFRANTVRYSLKPYLRRKLKL